MAYRHIRELTDAAQELRRAGMSVTYVGACVVQG